MGGGEEKKRLREDAATQRRYADIYERQANEQAQIAREDREFQQGLFDRISPFAEGLINQFDPEQFQGLERPDMMSKIRRDYNAEIADALQGRNRALADSEDFYTSSGMGRTGQRGMSAGAIYSMGNRASGDAFRRMKDRESQEMLDSYYDKVDRGNERAQLGVAGTNILAGQQGVFNPQSSWAGARGSMAGASGATGAGSQTTYQASQIPSTWSKIGGAAMGLAGTALGGPAAAGGLSGIWRR